MITNIIPAYISAGSAVISVCITAFSVWNLVQNNKQLKKEKKEHQARNISAWLTSELGETQLIFQNNSNSPIYNVFIIAVAIRGAATYDGEEAMKANNNHREKYYKQEYKDFDYKPIYPNLVFQKIPPGKFIKDFGFLESSMQTFFGIEYAFTDSYGHAWRVDGKGKLTELHDNYLYTKYELENPTSWDYLDFFNDSIEKEVPQKQK